MGGGFESLALHLRLVAGGIQLEIDAADGLRWVRLHTPEGEDRPFVATELTVALFVGHGVPEAVLTILGVALLAWAHLRNLRCGI